MFCWRCFFHGHLGDVPRKCIPHWEDLNSKYAYFTHFSAPNTIPDYYQLRRLTFQLYRWYLKRVHEIVLCANPACRKLVHAGFVFGEIFKGNHLEAFSNILKSNIEPIFFCCACYEQNGRGRLNLTHFRQNRKKHE